MFRFLDKRFYRRMRLDFDLRTLACEHIGMSRSYAPTELKRRLKPALEELEQLGFLEPLDPEERYSWVSRGCWRIILIRSQAADPETPPPSTETSALADALVAPGVTAEEADHKAKKKAKEESDKLKAREADLRGRWEKLPESEREAIRAAVKADNPGLGRWKNMLEPLCLAALEAREARPVVRQKGLFPA